MCEQRRRGRLPRLPNAKMVAVDTDIRQRCSEVWTDLQRRRFTADEYHRMAETGVLCHDDRVELVGGEIVEMTPIGSQHAACVDRLMVLLQRSVEGRGILRVQGPIRLDAHSELQPDLSVLKPQADFYASAHPGPGDVLFLVEVADASLRYDRDIKVSLYARAGIRESWLVDLKNQCVEMFTGPTPDGYRACRQIRPGDRLTSEALSVSFFVEDFLKPLTP